MTLGIFLDKHHKNYLSHLAFLTSQIIEKDNINIYSFDNLSKLSDYTFDDINIFLHRYCYIDFNKITKKHLVDTFVITNNSITPAIVVAPKQNIIPEILTVKEFMRSCIDNASSKSLSNECYLPNIGIINCKPNDAIFICFNDYYDFHIDDMKNCFYRKKEIFYKDKIYSIDPLTQLQSYKNTHCCKINNKLSLIWDKKLNKWKKLPKGVKIIC